MILRDKLVYTQKEQGPLKLSHLDLGAYVIRMIDQSGHQIIFKIFKV